MGQLHIKPMVIGMSSMPDVGVPLIPLRLRGVTTIPGKSNTWVVVVAELPCVCSSKCILVGAVQLKVGVKFIGRRAEPVVKEEVQKVDLPISIPGIRNRGETLVVDVTMGFVRATIAETADDTITSSAICVGAFSLDEGSEFFIGYILVDVGRQKSNAFAGNMFPP